MISTATRAEWQKDGYGNKGSNRIALSQLDGPFEEDFHAMRKKIPQLEKELKQVKEQLSRLTRPAKLHWLKRLFG